MTRTHVRTQHHQTIYPTPCQICSASHADPLHPTCPSGLSVPLMPVCTYPWRRHRRRRTGGCRSRGRPSTWPPPAPTSRSSGAWPPPHHRPDTHNANTEAGAPQHRQHTPDTRTGNVWLGKPVSHPTTWMKWDRLCAPSQPRCPASHLDALVGGDSRGLEGREGQQVELSLAGELGHGVLHTQLRRGLLLTLQTHRQWSDNKSGGLSREWGLRHAR